MCHWDCQALSTGRLDLVSGLQLSTSAGEAIFQIKLHNPGCWAAYFWVLLSARDFIVTWAEGMSNRLQTERSPKKISCRIIQGQPATKFSKIRLGWEHVFSHREMSCLASGLFLFSCINQPRADYKMNWRGRKNGISLAPFLPFLLPFSCRWHRYEPSSLHLAPKVHIHIFIEKSRGKKMWEMSSDYKENVGNVFWL